MKNILPTLLSGLCIIAVPAHSADTVIVDGGQPRAEIVIAEKASRMVKLAAEELQAGLKAITGAELPIVTTPGAELPVKVYVGRSAHTDRLGVTADDLKYGAFRIVSGPSYLVLLGDDVIFEAKGPVPGLPWPNSIPAAQQEWDRITGATWGNPTNLVTKGWHKNLGISMYDEGGSLNAVCEFLHQQGMRWYLPGELGTVVPQMKTIALPTINKTVRPDFALRHWMWSSYNGGTRDQILWERHLGLSAGGEVIGVSAVVHGHQNVHMRKAMQEAHPEYYALIGGKRDTDHRESGTACYSSKGLEEETIRYARAVLDHFGEPAVSLWPQDGFRKCQCDLCRDQSPSDLVWGFINRVATEVYKTHPDKLVTGGAYTPYVDPPASVAKFSPNVVVFIASIQRPGFADDGNWKLFQDRIGAWQAKLAPGHIIRNSNNRYTLSAPPKERVPFPVIHPHGIAREFHMMKGISMGDWNEVSRVKLDSEHQQAWRAPGLDHLNLYVQARMLWDAQLDIDALLGEYYTLFYGPAASRMQAAFTFAEAKYPRVGKPTPERLLVADRLQFVQQLLAAHAVAGDGVYAKRVQLILDELPTVEQLRRDQEVETRNLGRSADAPQVLGVVRPGDKPLRTYALRDLVTGKKPAQATSFSVTWERDALCFDIRCEEPDMANLVVSSEVYEGDSVALLLETPEHSYYQIEINPDGKIFDADRSSGKADAKWNSLAEVKAHRGADHWRIEVRIPVAGADDGAQDPLHKVIGSQPSLARPWYFNLGRARVREGVKTASAFSPTREASYHVPGSFGRLEIK